MTIARDETAQLNGGNSTSAEPWQVQPASASPLELVFGFVGPTGVDQDMVMTSLKNQLAAVGYKSHEISLSKIIQNYENPGATFAHDFQKIEKLMDIGDDLRRRSGDLAFIARLGIQKIRQARALSSDDQDIVSPLQANAYIIRSFKRPEEVSLYRDVYGKAFNLISIYASRTHRIKNLKRRFLPQDRSRLGKFSSPEELALHLMNRDYKERDVKDGQRVADTFPLADFFITSEDRLLVDEQLRRLIRLIFGDPYISPTIEEQSMFFAQAAAMRSLDLSRQVGAAIVSKEGDILSTGCNEVPKFGGGLYWDGGGDRCRRDFELGRDANVDIKFEILSDTISKLMEGGIIKTPEGPPTPDHVRPSPSHLEPKSADELARDIVFGETPFFEESKLFDVIEFGRAVHAEMAAISHAARAGIPLQKGRLFCTTFPCHICARHIVATGIEEVVFIEPYEKSRVSDLYSDSIAVEPSEHTTKQVAFRAFVGVAPRRYIELFQPTTKRKSKNGKIRTQEEYGQTPKLKRLSLAYIAAEKIVITQVVPPEPLNLPKEAL